MKVKVAAIQTKTLPEADEQKKNIEMAGEYVAEAAKQEAKFICFPEIYPGPWKAPLGYSPITALEEMASKYNVYIAAGANCPVPGKPGRAYRGYVSYGGELYETHCH
jgi:predicted amidohydrolase